MRASPLVRALVAGLLLLVVPGAQELLEDAAHFVLDGHTAHEAGHEGEQPGHCCSGLFHVCACHPHADGVVLLTVNMMPPTAAAPTPHVYRELGFRRGFHSLPFRPPQARG